MGKSAVNIYASALFKLSLESKTLKETKKICEAFVNVLTDKIEILEILKDPNITDEKKKLIVTSVLSTNSEEKCINEFEAFLFVLIDKKRISDIVSILETCVSKVNDFEGVAYGEVISACILNESERKQIELTIVKSTKYKRLKLEYKVDSSLIGGWVIHVDEYIGDYSIRGKLEQIVSKIKTEGM